MQLPLTLIYCLCERDEAIGGARGEVKMRERREPRLFVAWGFTGGLNEVVIDQ